MPSRADNRVVITGGSITLQFLIADGAFRRIEENIYAFDSNGAYISELVLDQSGRPTESRECGPGLIFRFHYEGQGGAFRGITVDTRSGIIIQWTPGTLTGSGPFSWQAGKLGNVVEIEGTGKGNGMVEFDPNIKYEFSLKPTEPVPAT